jgi:hypothetical protein
MVYDDGNDEYYLVKDAPIPAGGSLEAMAGNKLVLNQNEEIRVVASDSNSVDVLLSIMEIT